MTLPPYLLLPPHDCPAFTLTSLCLPSPLPPPFPFPSLHLHLASTTQPTPHFLPHNSFTTTSRPCACLHTPFYYLPSFHTHCFMICHTPPRLPSIIIIYLLFSPSHSSPLSSFLLFPCIFSPPSTPHPPAPVHCRLHFPLFSSHFLLLLSPPPPPVSPHGPKDVPDNVNRPASVM